MGPEIRRREQLIKTLQRSDTPSHLPEISSLFRVEISCRGLTRQLANPFQVHHWMSSGRGDDSTIRETTLTTPTALSEGSKVEEIKTRNTEKRWILNPILVGNQPRQSQQGDGTNLEKTRRGSDMRHKASEVDPRRATSHCLVYNSFGGEWQAWVEAGDERVPRGEKTL